MPDKVRYIQKLDRRFDAYVRELVEDKGFGHERAYAGIATRDEADEIRKRLRQAGRHLQVSVKAFYEECGKKGRCPAGHDCRYHVRYSAYRQTDAKAYKARLAKKAA